MPIPNPRDPEATARSLEAWLPTKVAGATDVVVSNMQTPNDGYSNETILFDMAWTVDGKREDAGLVLRIQPKGHQLFFEGDVRDVIFQARMMEGVQKYGVPVANVRWIEESRDALDDRFFVMDRVEGFTCTDTPSYNTAGRLRDASPAKRRELWDNAMKAFTSIQAIDWRGDFDFLNMPERGATGFEQQINYLDEWYQWATGGQDFRIIKDALDYVRAAKPVDDGQSGIVWGDARIGNMIFHDDFTVGAITDWEMASLGPREVDLGWWLFMDRWHAEGMAATRLEGLPTEDETVAVYVELAGHKPKDVHYWTVFAGLRFACIVVRSANQAADFSQVPEERDPRVNNGIVYVLAGLMGLPRPSLGMM